MKKVFAVVMVVAMMLALGVTAFADWDDMYDRDWDDMYGYDWDDMYEYGYYRNDVNGYGAASLTLDQAKQAALRHAGVNAADATFTKGHLDWENGREVYELEFYANGTEYDVDVDANSGEIVKFSTEFCGGYTAPNGYSNGYYYDDDMYDRDWDDMFDFWD